MTTKKIDIYLLNRGKKAWIYYASTTRQTTCKAAKQRFLELHKYLSPDQVKAKFSKNQ